MNRLLRRLIVAMISGVVVYAGFALYRGLHEIGESLGRFTWSAFGLACTLAFGNYLTRFLKWEYYLARLGIRGVPSSIACSPSSRGWSSRSPPAKWARYSNRSSCSRPTMSRWLGRHPSSWPNALPTYWAS